MRSCITRFPELTGGGTDTMPQNYRGNSSVERDWEEAQHAMSLKIAEPQ
jgi:hypothetical protein